MNDIGFSLNAVRFNNASEKSSRIASLSTGVVWRDDFYVSG
jgi:hypothetical protein